MAATISVIGAGYVGLPTAVLLAESGYKTYLIEIDAGRLNAIRKGRSFFYEEGIDALIEHSLQTEKLIPTDSYEVAIPKSDFIFSCVGTPDNPDGSPNLSFVFAAAEESLKYVPKKTIFIQKSTVPVGTGQKIVQLLNRKRNKHIDYVSSPEFLREGTAISDSLWPDRIVIGGNKRVAEKVLGLYKSIEKNRDKIVSRIGIVSPTGHPTNYFLTSLNSAELIKISSNAFLALKISFANSIAKLADHTGADITEVMDGVGTDRRISRAFLNAGRGYGGGCFPKDVSGLISSANEFGVDIQIMTAASDVNESMPGYIARKAQTKLSSLTGKRLAVLGLAFKAGTSDARRSPGIKLANILSRNGAKVSVYDPKANHEAEADLRSGITISNSLDKAIRGTDAIFIATDWPEFIELDFKKVKDLMRGSLIVDAMNALNENAVTHAGLQYTGIGRY